jgi:hypothetical protein
MLGLVSPCVHDGSYVFGVLGALRFAPEGAGRCREYCGEFTLSAIRIYASGIGESAYSCGQRVGARFCSPWLEQLAERVRRHGVNVTCVADVDYPVYEAILRRAEQSQADLIVTDCHAGSHIAPSLWRFTDWELMRLSPVPVLIVKQSRLYRRPNVLAAVDPSHAFSKPTQLDREILDLSAAFSVALRGGMHAIHAFLPSVAAMDASTGATAGAAMQTDLIASASAVVRGSW